MTTGKGDDALPGQDLPPTFAEVAADLNAASLHDRLQMLLEFGLDLPTLPARFADSASSMEQVHECQSPVFLAVEVAPGPVPTQRRVAVYFDAPREAPTTRGFAGILAVGLQGLTVAQVLAVPDDAPMRLGLAQAVSPLRMRGMVAMLVRVKRQVREQVFDS